MLEFENQMFLDILNEDGLIITAKGLGLERVFTSLLKVYSDAGNLVLVLGTSNAEEDFFISELDSMGVSPLPRVLSSEFGVNDRQSVYLEGGVIFGSSRILVVDMLMNRLPVELLTGILVYRAHRVIETSQDAFILRLFCQKNKTGFIKAFTSSPVSFTRGFGQVARVMRSLFVRQLFLWPRFQATIQSTLKEHQPDVVELRVPMTSMMVKLQTAVLDLILFTIKELKRINVSLELDEMTVENALSKCYRKIVRFQLEPVWHQLSEKTRQLVSDLGTLRTLLVSLTQYDCVTFNVVVTSLRTTEKALRTSGWMLMDAAETLFLTSKARVYGTSKAEPEAELLLEENPKWAALVSILDEIEAEVKCAQVELGGPLLPSFQTLIVAEDERTCLQLRQILQRGARDVLLSLHQSADQKNRRIFEDATRNEAIGLKRKIDCAEAQVEIMCESIIIQPLKDSPDAVTAGQLLYRLRPRYVIMYDCDLTFVRQVEVYQAMRKEDQVRVYFVIYDASAEEQAYLTTIRREKEAFEMLIREKATMVIPHDRVSRLDEHPDLTRDSRKASEMALVAQDSRQSTEDKQTVIVDMREFRSELPSLLHRRGIDIIPVTIEVGDYILSPEICVERKSLSDLIGSLNSGRLYNQVQSMSRHYSRPMLLIEFEHDKPFALMGKYYLSSDDSSLTDVTSRLQLLTIHFPKLRIVWSPGPYATAEMFQEFKANKEQPDVSKAAAISSDAYSEANEDVYNPAIRDFLSKLPGVNSKNIWRILRKVDNLGQLISLSKEELNQLLENSITSNALWEAIHSQHQEADGPAEAKPWKGKKWKGRAKKWKH